jgi:hypothetical protein
MASRTSDLIDPGRQSGLSEVLKPPYQCTPPFTFTATGSRPFGKGWNTLFRLYGALQPVI